MKSLATIFAVLVVVATGYAQNTPWPASGNVGIGTTNPQVQLQVMGSIFAGNTADTTGGFYYGGPSAGLLVGKYSTSPWPGTNGLFVAGNSLLMANVGIGTTQPGAKLNVQNGYILAEGGIISSNRTAVGLEFNKLFNATCRYTVTQSGGGSTLNLAGLFDGIETQNYFAADPGVVPSSSNPYVITISGLPDIHVQMGAWIGWTSRYTTVSSSFKIEGWDNYSAKNWVTFVDVNDETDNNGRGYNEYMIKVPPGSYTSLRITFRNAEHANYFGLSEIFFIHPEATRLYEGLLPSSMWEGNNGNVGIGTTNPTEKLSVNGKIRAKEVIVETTGWSDHVFADSYKLQSLSEVEQHIKTEKHLPGVPSAQEVAAKGVSVGDMQAILLAKIEELTLHQIAQEKELAAQRTKLVEASNQLEGQAARIATLEAENMRLRQ